MNLRPLDTSSSRTGWQHILIEIVGWYGALAIIMAYALVSFEAISSKSYIFQLLNLTGALGVMVISVSKRVSQSIVLNIFWAAIALVALWQITVASE